MDFKEKKRQCAWLDHDKYDQATVDYNFWHWWAAFSQRHSCRWDLFEWIGKEVVVNDESKISYITSLRLIYQVHEKSENFEYGDYYGRLSDGCRTVRSLDAGNMMDDVLTLIQTQFTSKDDLNNWLTHGDTSGKIGLDLNAAYEGIPGIAYAVIDVTASDEAIIAGLLEWLTEIRREYEIPKNKKTGFTKADIARWRELRLLQYLDLKLFAGLTGIKLTQQEVGAILFPDDIYDINLADKVRRSVEPEAERMITLEVLAMLFAQAGRELRKRGPA